MKDPWSVRRMKPPVCMVPFEDVAARLHCHPEVLRRMLVWLSTNPSMIQFGPGHYDNLVLTKIEPLTDDELEECMEDEDEEIFELEDLFDRQDARPDTVQPGGGAK